MAEAFEQQQHSLSFEERLGLLIDRSVELAQRFKTSPGTKIGGSTGLVIGYRGHNHCRSAVAGDDFHVRNLKVSDVPLDAPSPWRVQAEYLTRPDLLLLTNGQVLDLRIYRVLVN
jgi:hypothetical protein